MKITMEYSRKEGRPNYGSEGASVSIQLDCGDDPASVAAALAAGFTVCRRAVEDQLATADSPEDADADPAPPAHRPDRTADRPAPARWEAPTDNRSPDRIQYDRNRPTPATPRDGRQLCAWVKKMEAAHPLWPQWLKEWGEENNLSWKWTDWDRETVRQAVEALETRNSYGPPVPNGAHRN